MRVYRKILTDLIGLTVNLVTIVLGAARLVPLGYIRKQLTGGTLNGNRIRIVVRIKNDTWVAGAADRIQVGLVGSLINLTLVDFIDNGDGTSSYYTDATAGEDEPTMSVESEPTGSQVDIEEVSAFDMDASGDYEYNIRAYCKDQN